MTRSTKALRGLVDHITAVEAQRDELIVALTGIIELADERDAAIQAGREGPTTTAYGQAVERAARIARDAIARTPLKVCPECNASNEGLLVCPTCQGNGYVKNTLTPPTNSTEEQP